MDIVSRSEWGAPASRSHIAGLSGSQGCALHYNGPPMRLDGKPHSACVDAVRGIRRFHVQTRGWADIAYSFLCCPHGVVFEGRGWDKRTAANGTNYGNSWGHAVMCLAGDGEQPTDRMQAAVAALVRVHDRRYGRTDLRPHSSFKATACPGGPLRWFATSDRWKTLDTTPTDPTEEGDEMREGDNDRAVEVLQNRLNDTFAAGLTVDGDYGPSTADAVGAAQRELGFKRTPSIAHGMFQAALYMRHQHVDPSTIVKGIERAELRNDNQHRRIEPLERLHADGNEHMADSVEHADVSLTWPDDPIPVTVVTSSGGDPVDVEDAGAGVQIATLPIDNGGSSGFSPFTADEAADIDNGGAGDERVDPTQPATDQEGQP